ncbi:MAG: molybdopterin synthase sulfur carrier subunit [Firmicutes bacterium HGW-Firmicutes-7]|nr:MAG: molybdopterin synthase sulfur carrier subunit [Firmicutes bacterium HGW-Firmicutes-7]
MQIKVRLFATLREGRGKEMFLELEEGQMPQDIIEKLQIPVEDVAILLINGRDGQLNTKLISTDVVSIFPPVGGG